MIPFNKPTLTGFEEEQLIEAIKVNKLSGDGPFTKKCNRWFEDQFDCLKSLLTTSCTHALEMAAILADIEEGDEVIMPSFTFVSTANAFVLRGAKIKFIDIRPDTLNMDEALFEDAITPRTKAIVPVHYAGVSCEMDTISDIAARYQLLVIEDAAQGVMSSYKGKKLGTIGDLGCYSFHETKNYNCGEGGALIINSEVYLERAEIIREKGTDRSKFIRGQVDKYSWVDIGSSFLPSELNAAFLYAQLTNASTVNEARLRAWDQYYVELAEIAEAGIIQLPHVPSYCQQNGHMFHIRVKDMDERSRLIEYLKHNNIQALFHYIPLHSSAAGLKYGEFIGIDRYTTSESERLLRLPMFYGITEDEIVYICNKVKEFYRYK